MIGHIAGRFFGVILVKIACKYIFYDTVAVVIIAGSSAASFCEPFRPTFPNKTQYA
jgi:hypothetical protein